MVSLTATPDANSVFAGWSGACAGMGTCTVTMDAVKAVTATFNRAAPPTLACSASPKSLWPPNHKMVNIAVSVTMSNLSGFKLISVTSNEPDNGPGDGNTTNDIQGWAIGTPDTNGQLRAERSGTGNGRIYTLTYTGQDGVGNSASCSATVTVPHDQKK